MRFAASEWLFGATFAFLVAGVLIVQGIRLSRDKRKFGDTDLVEALVTSNTSMRRAMRGTLLCLAVALAAVAAAGPQYGRGTRVLPATNLDVVLVIDYSKSMYARDVSPSRIERAKIEVARLVSELGGARFGAVAFAGETMSFPLTSDGAAIAQFFRSLNPADMPVGGTGIARALVAGKELLARDPLSERHERVILLVTDGEDLEGDPVAAAEDISAAGIRLEVVQIGGRSPEPIPDIDADGQNHGLRRDSSGRVLTTSLSPEGEAQLARIASLGGGSVVRAEKGQVGINVVAQRLRKLMTEELSERVETVYADVYHFPLAAVILLLIIETFIGLAKKRNIEPEPPPGKLPGRRLRRLQKTAVLLIPLSLGCEPFDQLFERESPVVNEAISALESGERDRATDLLTDYLETGPCEATVIGAGERARRLGDASLDLALSLAGPFPEPKKEDETAPDDPAGSEPAPADPAPAPVIPPAPSKGPSQPLHPGAPDGPQAQQQDPEKNSRVECSLRLLSPVAENRDHPAALRARALYLMGNLELSRGNFEEAVTHYDRALLLTPGTDAKEADPIGLSVAHNRALSLRLKEAKQAEQQQSNTNQDQEQDPDQESEDQENQEKNEQEKGENGDQEQKQPEDSEQEDDQSPPNQEDEKQDEPQDGQPGKPDEPEGEEQPEDSESQPQEQRSEAGEGNEQPAPARPSASQDARILDRLEQAPTLQQHDAKRRAGVIRVRPTMEDK